MKRQPTELEKYLQSDQQEINLQYIQIVHAVQYQKSN